MSDISVKTASFRDCSITISKIEPIGLAIKTTWIIDGLTTNKPEDKGILLYHSRCLVDVPVSETESSLSAAQLEFSISSFKNGLSVKLNTSSRYPALFEIQLDQLDVIDYEIMETLLPAKRVTISPDKCVALIGCLPLSINQSNFTLGITVQPFQCNVKSSPSSSSSSQQISNLAVDLKRFCYTPNNYPDIQIETKDKMMLNAHKFILAARSQVLRDIIEERKFKLGLHDTNVITLRDVEARPLSIVLHWMYTDEILDEITEEMESVLHIAMTYGVAGIMGHIENKLIELCDQDNMCRLLDLAKQNGMQKAGHHIAKYVGESFGLI